MRVARRPVFVVIVLVAVVLAVLLSMASRATPHVREQIVGALNDRFENEVALESLQVSVFPRPEVTGSGLAVRWEGRTDVPPLIRIGTFSSSAGVLGLLGTPLRLRDVTLERLDIHIPPGGMRRAGNGAEPAKSRDEHGALRRLTIDEIVSHAARLEIASKEPGKLPRLFEIADLHILGYGHQEGADFRATLTNPTPRGRIETRGRFGPWQAAEPRTTPVRGEYTFAQANMDTIKGLGGTLSSRGTYKGVLERIEVTGETDTPDFSLDIAGNPVPLTTRFRAIVDGTNGNTYLEQVDARLLESHIHAKGAVVRAADVKGRHVTLDIRIDQARLEDLLKLAVRSAKPLLTGAVKVNTKFVLPAGDEDVIRKLRLDGEFTLKEARFSNFDVQKRINLLSQKGKGEDAPVDGPSVVSQLNGRFELRDAALSFSRLTFAVPGAEVQLAGTYDLARETLDFTGHLLLDASLSETTSGMKAVAATLAQPFFRRKGGGSKIPIRVGGTRARPAFGLDVGKALGPG